MATRNALKLALRQKTIATGASSPTQPLSDSQYDAGFDILGQALRPIYQDFIIPQLSQLVDSLCNSRTNIEVLEIGPGPESVLGHLPIGMRQKVKRYVAFEPNDLFATRLEECFRSTSETESPLSCLESSVVIHRIPFDLDSNKTTATASDGTEKFDLILFCHSMYGMKPKSKFIEPALGMLLEQPEGAMVVVFHRDGTMHLDGLVCHRTASLPTGVIRVADNNEVLDCFAPFIAGYVTQDVDTDTAVKSEWRKICRALGRCEEANPDHLLFSSPDIMVAFTRHATMLPELTAQVPVVIGEVKIKNREARLHHPASIIRPTEIQHIQQCVRWALKHGASLTVVSGSHSGQCLWPNVVAIDMSAFDQIHVLTVDQEEGTSGSDPGALVVVESGCKSGEIISQTMTAGLTVPMGGRPSVGAGLWLQGGIGHLARLHGLACDAIVGAVVVSVASGEVLCVGNVPSQHQPAGAVRPDNEIDLLWATRGAGTNVGIVVSVTFKAYPAPVYSIWNWSVQLNDSLEARLKLGDLDESIASKLPRNCSVDIYLYWDADRLSVGVNLYESSTTNLTLQTPTFTPTLTAVRTMLGPEDDSKTVDGVGLFQTELYMSGMHGGHSGGKTSSFKRCLFLKGIGAVEVADTLVKAVETRPSPFCYLHLLQGGGAVADVADNATAFGCRGWEYACVVTGVWPRDEDGTEVARAAVQWVYDVATDLLPLSIGAYGADLGPRDAVLAAQAFGLNLSRLARLKHNFDPSNVLAYACPLPKAPNEQKLIILVTGEHGAGKDESAGTWASMFATSIHKSLKVQVVSISDATKREYAAATGANLKRLLHARAYKEQHRPALTAYFQDQMRERPQLPEEHFLSVVSAAADVDVLLITGMRDEAPVAAFSHLVPDSRLIEVYVQASKETRKARRGGQGSDDDADDDDNKDTNSRPSLLFNNDTTGDDAAKQFCEDRLFPFFHEDLNRLADMVRLVPNFPSPGIEFRDVLGIAQQPGGLVLCTSLLQSHFTGDWANVDAVACCETGGWLFASALAPRVGVPLALIREAGKLPPPTISVVKSASHISASDSVEKRIQIGKNVIPSSASVVVVDDVLATGKTLCAVLQLLEEAGIRAEDISVLVVAEFPVHRGRHLLRQGGFGGVKIESLLVLEGA